MAVATARNHGAGFRLVTDYQASGDQPAAISELVKGIERGRRLQTLQGGNGSRKNFTMANWGAWVQEPTVGNAPKHTGGATH